jgi:hypothetical protein
MAAARGRSCGSLLPDDSLCLAAARAEARVSLAGLELPALDLSGGKL